MSEVKEVEEHEILKKVDPAPWKDVPLVLNNRDYQMGYRQDLWHRRIKDSNLVVVVFHYRPLHCQFYWNGLGLPCIHWSRCLGE